MGIVLLAHFGRVTTEIASKADQEELSQHIADYRELKAEVHYQTRLVEELLRVIMMARPIGLGVPVAKNDRLSGQALQGRFDFF